ncbi:unnamed protein product [Caenorhabditis brenneri]
MTVSYNLDVSSTSLVAFLKLQLRWRGSVWKSVMRELFIFSFFFAVVTSIYRTNYFLSEEQRVFWDNFAALFDQKLDYIPLTFMLGFFVTIIVGRWNDIFLNIGWVDNTALLIATYIRGSDEKRRILRRTALRYMVLTQVIIFRDISMRVRKRFPTLETVVAAGFVLESDYHASRAIPFTIMLAVSAICLFVILPLTLVGTVIGRNMAGTADYPCRVNAVPRPIPDKKWFVQPWLITLAGGVLPFGSIFIEMYFIFTSFWAYKIYYVYGFMLLVTIILSIVTVCVTIVFSYFLLNAEDYRWRWTSFACGASTAFYVYMYSMYYFFFKTKMYGLFQTVFYFGYMGIFAAALGLMTGTIGYVGTAKFVRKIYQTVKID